MTSIELRDLRGFISVRCKDIYYQKYKFTFSRNLHLFQCKINFKLIKYHSWYTVVNYIFYVLQGKISSPMISIMLSFNFKYLPVIKKFIPAIKRFLIRLKLSMFNLIYKIIYICVYIYLIYIYVSVKQR